ncbi:MAG: ChaN family lipoprotein [Planctomycetes bacterium]|nr:ChaN family lipoprotein [Planctomycetota bacterium]
MRNPIFMMLPLTLLGLAACTSTAPRAIPLADAPRVLAAGARSGSVNEAVDGARVVLVGEMHDRRAQHDFQRDVLERVASKGGKFMIGMEMFQRPAQPALDDYVAGKIDEVEMLRRTEYYTRWVFDHTMYAPMWRFCREHGGRVVALNPKGETNRKISRGGLASLTAEERTDVAADIDLTNVEHKKRILAVFEGGAHKLPPEPLQRMYEAMTSWDETMAESAARALEAAGSDSRMVIIAGTQHIQEFTGVAARLQKRMPGLEPLVIVCRVAGQDEDEGVTDAQLGHFVVRCPETPVGEAPKIGVGLGEPTPKGLPITAIVPDGIAAKAGIVVGDVISMLGMPNGELRPVRDMTDFKYVLGEAHLRARSMPLVGEHADGTKFTITLNLRETPSTAVRTAAL